MADIAMLVTNRYEPDPRVHKEAASLVAAGHRVRVYAFDRQQEMPRGDEILDGVELHRLRLGHYPPGQLLAVARGLWRFAEAVKQLLLRDPPDVVHCHDQDTCAMGTWWQGQRARSGGRGLFVFDAHDFYWTYPLMADVVSPWRKLAARATAELLKLAGWHYARRADLLVTVSQAIATHPGFAELYRRWGAQPLVVWNAPRKVRKIPALPARFTVGYFGYVREPAMFRWLISAIAQLPQDERPALRIAGGGVEYAKVERLLREGAQRLDLPLQLSGPFSMQDLPSLMADCSVQFCVYPLSSGNMAYTVPVKLFDAVAHGRKVIGNAQTLMGDFITANGWGEVVPEGNPESLAAALLKLRQELADTSIAPSLTAPPSWEEQADKLRGAYARLLQRA
jgi:glycosyltransferase involved in cell wall biosynthesis